MQSHSAKEAEAEGYMKSGKKHSEKTLFHFKANYNSAAEDFDKAARIYANLSNYPMARDAWTRASEAHQKAHNDFNAANSMEKLGDFIAQYMVESQSSASSGGAKPIGEHLYEEAIRSYEAASTLYGAATNGLKQAAALKKVADLVSRMLAAAKYSRPGIGGAGAAAATAVDTARLQKEYKRIVPEVIALMERNWEATESKPFDLPDIYRSYMLFCLRAGDIEGAVQTEKRMIGIVSTSPADGTYDDSKNLFRVLNQPTNAAKAGLEIIVLCLSTSVDDGYTWANIEMGRLGAVFGFCSSSEERAAAALLAAYADRDEEALQEALKVNSCFNFLAADVSRLAKKLTLGAKGRPKETGTAAASVAAGRAAPASSTQAPVDASETDEDDLR
ncbi:Gamma-soluble NSF attachment protein [Novymonas esmeraldas]|uniref:Gamma-soluble NSF attachment protein n=1 Tax=Novymonas esmeraldas TaxID=1808958 RepID=A0AAW0EWZ3_9TRYP